MKEIVNQLKVFSLIYAMI